MVLIEIGADKGRLNREFQVCSIKKIPRNPKRNDNFQKNKNNMEQQQQQLPPQSQGRSVPLIVLLIVELVLDCGMIGVFFSVTPIVIGFGCALSLAIFGLVSAIANNRTPLLVYSILAIMAAALVTLAVAYYTFMVAALCGISCFSEPIIIALVVFGITQVSVRIATIVHSFRKFNALAPVPDIPLLSLPPPPPPPAAAYPSSVSPQGGFWTAPVSGQTGPTPQVFFIPAPPAFVMPQKPQ